MLLHYIRLLKFIKKNQNGTSIRFSNQKACLMAVAVVVAEAQEWERGEIAAAGIAVDLAPVLAAVFACLPRSLGALLLSRISENFECCCLQF